MSCREASSYPDYYKLLSISPSAEPAEVKVAYHRALLLHHPDKQTGNAANVTDMDVLKKAFTTLYTPDLKVQYDRSRAADTAHLGPRPAQVVSLEEFEEHPDPKWTYSCRCGGVYAVTEDTLEAGIHLVGCGSCSETVWVGYELVEDSED